MSVSFCYICYNSDVPLVDLFRAPCAPLRRLLGFPRVVAMASCKWTRWRGRGYCSRDRKVVHIFTIIILKDMFWKSHHFVMIYVCKGQMGEFSRLSGNSSLHLKGTAATAAKVWILMLEHQRHPFADGGSATSFFRLFTMPNMRRKTFICYYLWFRWRCNPSLFP